MASPKTATGTRKARRRSRNATTRTATSASQNIRNDTAIAPPMPATCTNGVNAICVCPKCQGNSRGMSSSASTTAVADRIASTSKTRCEMAIDHGDRQELQRPQAGEEREDQRRAQDPEPAEDHDRADRPSGSR